MIHNEEEPKYDKDCQALILANDAEAACVVVVGGNKDTGFSLSIKDPQTPRGMKVLALIPEVLRRMAAEIERDLLGSQSRVNNRKVLN
jgi:hypothetical protein